MEKLVQVTAARPHRTGYAEDGKVDKGGTYSVPEDRVAALVRQKLIVAPKVSAPGKGDEG